MAEEFTNTFVPMGAEKYEFESEFYTRDELVTMFLDKTYCHATLKLQIENAKSEVRELSIEFKSQENNLGKLAALLQEIDSSENGSAIGLTS